MNIKKIKKLLKDPKRFILDSKFAKTIRFKKTTDNHDTKLSFVIFGSDAELIVKTKQSIIESEKALPKHHHSIIELNDELLEFGNTAFMPATIMDKIDTEYVKPLFAGEELHKSFISEIYNNVNFELGDDIVIHSFRPDVSTRQQEPALAMLKSLNVNTAVQVKDYILPSISCSIIKTELLNNIKIDSISDERNFKITAMLDIMRTSGLQQGYQFINAACTGTQEGARFDVGLQEIAKSADSLIKLLNVIKTSLSDYSNDSHKVKTILFLVHNLSLILLRNKKVDELLCEKEKEEAKGLFTEVIELIGMDTIKSFSSSNFNHIHKIGYLKILGQNADRDICYIEESDEKNKIVKFKIASHSNTFPRLYLDGNEVTPGNIKIKNLSILNIDFSYEIYFWLEFKKAEQKLSIRNLFTTELLVSGKRLKTESYAKILSALKSKEKIKIELPRKVKLLRNIALSSYSKNKFKSCWLFVDNDLRADDNAEHFYRYVKNNQKNTNAFFLLNKNSPDWKRLKDDGFKLIEFGSLKHRLALLNANFLLSSHANPAIVNYLPRKHYSDIMKYKFVFLQHGVTKDDQSEWLNSRKIDYLVTAGTPEFNDISGNGRYRYTSKETILTGFPRYDNLQRTGTNSQILIMPTWRKSLAGELMKKSSKRIKNSEFINSQFCKEWGSFLQSEKLKNLVEIQNFNILFLPHPNLSDYLDELAIPDYIEIGSLEKCSIQQVFKESDLLITDYSSVAFDVAYMRKPVIYYQFDSDTFFSEHSYSKGYYDYEKNGFGYVAKNKTELTNTLIDTVKNGCKLDDFYNQRINDFFPYDDDKNSERLFNHLVRKKPIQPTFEVIYEYLKIQLSQSDIDTAEKTLRELSQNGYNLLITQKEKVSKIINEMVFWAQIQNRKTLLSKLSKHAERMLVVVPCLQDNDHMELIKDPLAIIITELNSIVNNQSSSGNILSSDDLDRINFIIPETALTCKYIVLSGTDNTKDIVEDFTSLRSNASFKQSPSLVILDAINLIKDFKTAEALSFLRKVKLVTEQKELILGLLLTHSSPELRHGLQIEFLNYEGMSSTAHEAYLTLSNHVSLSQYESYFSNHERSDLILSFYLDALYSTKSYSSFISVFEAHNASEYFNGSIENQVRFLIATFIHKGIEALNSELIILSEDDGFITTFDSMFLNRDSVSLDIVYEIIEQIIEKDLYSYTCSEVYKYSLHFYKKSRPCLAKKLSTISVMKMHERFYEDANNWKGSDDYKTMIDALSELNYTAEILNKMGD